MSYAIEVDQIVKLYGKRKVIDQISFKVRHGTIHGFLGPNGAGKTTTMKLITGLANFQAGDIRIYGQARNNETEQFHGQLGFLLEDSPLYKDLKVYEYLKFIASMKRVAKKDIDQYVEYCLEVLDIYKVKDRLIGHLSRGFKQRVAIAQAIIHRPKVVILDEPTIGLDPQSMIEIRELILKLKKDHTILLSSHLLHEMSLVCDEITIISDGKILASGTLDELRMRLGQLTLVTMEFKNLSAKFIQFIKGHDSVEVVEENQNEGLHTIKYTSKDGVDIRSDLIKKAVNFDCELVGVYSKQSSLENIFLDVTQREKQL